LLLGLVLLLPACQVALLFDAFAPFRVFIRTAGFGTSLAFIFLIHGRQSQHPAKPWAVAVIVIVVLNIFHPTTNSLLAGLAQATMYVAILAPLFWAGRIPVTERLFEKILLIFWGVHALSAVFGVLQTYYPGQFQPRISDVLSGVEGYVRSLTITLASGETVFRPMGLTDVPGGAAASGFYAALLGVGFLLNSQARTVRLLAPFSIAGGLFCIYLCQVRVWLVMFAVCTVTFAVVLLLRGDVKRFVVVCLLMPAAFALSLLWAISVGGESVTRRLATLTEARPEDVYYSNRGIFLEQAFLRDLPDYPAGAGLGRWGMMHAYFGERNSLRSTPLHVEIQWSAWVFDGGLPLMIAYVGALLAACHAAWRVARRMRTERLGAWAALLLAYNVGALACTFSYPYFISQGGMEFWLLNACLLRATARRGAVTATGGGLRWNPGRCAVNRDVTATGTRAN
jgi:hypothetical protein